MYRFVLFLTLFSYAASKSELSCRHIREFVDRHNYWRLKLAKGEIPNQPAASEMKYIIWDEELAAKAAQWASNNEYKHNPDKSVGSNRFFTGENIFSTASTDLSYKFEPRSVVDSWFSEHKDFNYGPVEAWQFEPSAKMIGHYTQVAWSDSIYLGCGVSKEYKNGWLNYYVVCNYGPTSKNSHKEKRKSDSMKGNGNDISMGDVPLEKKSKQNPLQGELDPNSSDHVVAMTQLKETIASLQKKVQQKEMELLSKDKLITELKAQHHNDTTDLRIEMKNIKAS
ncbi:unnamed protein product [Pieris brassicae]|uniref:SCP domain-containing protein n=1 Tax=Pieris brassicae TaxID=7116 RepID=A0A9P0XHZ5_PIEBR|nr:unnamed protein product [Pieris brassicae]